MDALSADGRFGLTIIAFIGSVFSPYYAKTGWADPFDHVTLNVALYGPRGPVWSPGWAMTERGRGDLHRGRDVISIGPSSLSWEGDALVIRFDERATPVPAPLRGAVKLFPQALVADTFALDGERRHLWRPIAPRARVEVALANPALSWSGQGYFDTNGGADPLETAFTYWNWSRAHRAADTLIFYDVEREAGDGAALALRVDAHGRVEPIAPPPFQALPPTAWLMGRKVRAEPGERIRHAKALEDAPFYSRSILKGRYGGEAAEIVHESLSAARLRSPVVKRLLPYRMPRRAG